MFITHAFLEYFNSPEGLNRILLILLVVGGVNVIFITFSFKIIYGVATQEREKQKLVLRILAFTKFPVNYTLEEAQEIFSQLLKQNVFQDEARGKSVFLHLSDGKIRSYFQ